MSDTTKIAIGISSCLLGESVRFDSGHKNNNYIKNVLGDFFEFKPFCPEVSIGLGVPRQPIRLVQGAGQGDVRCMGSRTKYLDVTQALRASAEKQFPWVSQLGAYIVKKDSPSCGMERVKVYNNNSSQRVGVGIYTAVMRRAFPYLPVEEEGRLGDPVLRENFIKRVFIYKRWRDIEKKSENKKDLVAFHAQHKHIFMSHDQVKARELGQLMSQVGKMDLVEYRESYLALMTDILHKPANKKNHSNVLKHLQGHLKHRLDGADKAELQETIEQYRCGYLPLVVPIAILRHHFRKHPDPYVSQSYYMQPHPQELKLYNVL